MKILSLLAFLAVSSAYATSVSLSSAPLGRSVVESDGSALANGSLVLVGTFSNISALEVLPPIELASAAGWTQFGNALAIGSVFGNPGKLIGTTSDLTDVADAFNNKPIYLWVFNGPTIESSTEYGVFRADSGVPTWNFPVNNGGIGDLITISADDGALAASGGLGSVNGSHLQLVAISSVPEPATFGLLALGGAFLHLRRLRRR